MKNSKPLVENIEEATKNAMLQVSSNQNKELFDMVEGPDSKPVLKKIIPVVFARIDKNDLLSIKEMNLSKESINTLNDHGFILAKLKNNNTYSSRCHRKRFTSCKTLKLIESLLLHDICTGWDDCRKSDGFWAHEFNVARSTINRSIKSLSDKGLINKKTVTAEHGVIRVITANKQITGKYLEDNNTEPHSQGINVFSGDVR